MIMFRKCYLFRFICCRLLTSRYFLLNVLILVLITIIIYMFYLTLLCSAWQVTTAVDVLCELYEKRKIAGNLCHDLCTSGTVHLGSCQTQHLAKEVVFEADWNNLKIVIKSDYLDFRNYDNIGMKSSSEVVQYPTVSEFSTIVANHVKINLNVSVDPKKVLSKLWSYDIDHITEVSSLPAAMNSIWSLIQQNEYILIKSFEEKKVFPKVVGTCGHFYAVEYLKPLPTTNWFSRVSSALKLIDLSIKLDKNFHQPLHLCDVKYNHMGIDSDGNVRVLDADTAYFKPIIDKMILNGKKCYNDVDCSFWDCLSKCHPVKKICTEGVTNNNLQVICEKLFLGRSSHSLFLKPFENGLLIQTPNSNTKILNDLLEDCARLNGYFSWNDTYMMIKEKLRFYFLHELQRFSHRKQ